MLLYANFSIAAKTYLTQFSSPVQLGIANRDHLHWAIEVKQRLLRARAKSPISELLITAGFLTCVGRGSVNSEKVKNFPFNIYGELTENMKRNF